MPRGRPRKTQQNSPVARIILSAQSSPEPKRLKFCGMNFIQQYFEWFHPSAVGGIKTVPYNHYDIYLYIHTDDKTIKVSTGGFVERGGIQILVYKYTDVETVCPQRMISLIADAKKYIDSHICFKCGFYRENISAFPHYCEVCMDEYEKLCDSSKDFHDTTNNDQCPLTMDKLEMFQQTYITKCCNTGYSYDAFMEYCKSKQHRQGDHGILPLTCPTCRAEKSKFLDSVLKYH
jgi:hypothetical protein